MSLTAEAEGRGAAAPLTEADSAESLIQLGYPLPLNDIQSTSEACLTASEMWALENTWKFIKNLWRRYALELYVDFYTENHELINRFRDNKTNKISAQFSDHAYSVFLILQEVVENGFKNWTKTTNFIKQMSRCHVANAIPLDDIMFLCDAVKAQLLAKCDGLVAPTLLNALDKLFEEIFEQHRQRLLVADDDVSVNIDE